MPAPDIQALLASLLSKNANNPYANINDPVIRPPVIPNTPWTGPNGYQGPGTPWGTPPTTVAPPGGVTPTDPSGGGRGGTGPGGDTYGQMTAAERAALGNYATAFGALGALNPGLAVIGYTLRGALANDKYGFAGKRGEVGITEQDVRDKMDFEGAFAARDLESRREAQEARREADRQMTGPGIMGADALGPREAPSKEAQGYEGGYAGPSPTDTTPDSPTDTESGANSGGGPGGGAAGGGPGGGSPGGGPDGEGQGGEGRGGDTDWKGGVRVGTPEKPGRTVFGKVGKETAIFIPEIMKKMGIQGREQEVIRALKTMLQILEGSKRSKASESESPKAERKEHANGGRRD